MRSFTVKGVPEIRFGTGVSSSAGEILKEAGVKKALLVYDSGVKAAGIVDSVEQGILAEGIQTVHFDRVVINPTDVSVEEAAALANNEKVDAVIAVGGGSSMDTAKVLSVYRYCNGPLKDYFDGYSKGDPCYKERRDSFLMVLPTTAGTGAEMTAGGVITDSALNAKRSFPSLKCIPDVALLDPKLSVTLDKLNTAATGMDALCQVIESMTSVHRSMMTDMIGSYAVKQIWENLPKVVRNPDDLEARGAMLYCANVSLNNGGDTHLGHAIATAMGGTLHMVHGEACALVLPEIVRFVDEFARPELRLIAENMGLDANAENVAELIAEAVEQRNGDFGILTPKQRGYDKALFMSMKEEVFGAQAWFLERMDRRPNETELNKMLEKIYG